MVTCYTHLYGIEFLEPLIVDDEKPFDMFELFKVMPSEFLKTFLTEFKSFTPSKPSALYHRIIKSTSEILRNRSGIDETMRELRTMSPEFMEHINEIVSKLIAYEKKRAAI